VPGGSSCLGGTMSAPRMGEINNLKLCCSGSYHDGWGGGGFSLGHTDDKR
jgi:hypothetical protein